VDPFDSFQIVLDIIGKQYEGMSMGFLLSAFIVGEGRALCGHDVQNMSKIDMD